MLLRLLMSANRVVLSDELAFDIWDGRPPDGMASTLKSHISLLRRHVGSDRITSVAGGYRLNIGVGELDVADFESELASGRHALRQDEHERAVEHLEQAIDWWRGPAAFFEAGAATWALGEASRLKELKLEADEMLLDARLALGQHHDVVASSEAAVNEEPLREQRWASMMLALYRCGRQTEALRGFQSLHTLLDLELGIEPSPELVALERAIILHDPELDWVPLANSRRAGGRGLSHQPPLPSRLELQPSVGVIGRRAQLERLTKAVRTRVDQRRSARRSHIGRGRYRQVDPGRQDGPGGIRGRG